MYLGIDLGTSEIKALIINDEGQMVASHGVALDVQRPHPHWSEQSPARWWDAVNEIVQHLRAQVPDVWMKIQSIGLSGQQHGAVLLDDKGEVLRPCILWNDTRSALECDELTAANPEFHSVGGNLVMPGFTAPKLVWVAKHEPEIFKKTAKVLLPKDYVRFKMTGQYVGDMSDAAGTLWLDVEGRRWSDSLLKSCGLSQEQMPRLVEGSAASATLSPEIASHWGLSSNVVVAGGGGDNAAGAVGAGAVNNGDAFISLGTSGVIFVVNDRFLPSPASAVHAFCHALPNRWHQMSVMLSAASCLRWICKTLSVSEKEVLQEVALLSHDEKMQAPIFLPYLSGERTPYNDPNACGSFHGLRNESSRAALVYSVLEGVTFGLADGFDVLKATGSQMAQLSLTGGGARSSFWAQLIADTLQSQIVIPAVSASGSLGAARLAWLAVGGKESEVCLKPEISQTFDPAKPLDERTAKRRELFSFLYQQQKQAREIFIL